MVRTGLKLEPLRCDVHSRNENAGGSIDTLQLVLRVDKGEHTILCRHRFLKKDLPVSMFMFGLGIESDLEILAEVGDISTWEALYSN